MDLGRLHATRADVVVVGRIQDVGPTRRRTVMQIG